MYKSLFIAFQMIMLFTALPTTLSAQLKESEKASLAFEIDFDRLRKDPLLKQLDAERKILQAIPSPAFQRNVESIAKISGLIQIPNDYEGIKKFAQAFAPRPVRPMRKGRLRISKRKISVQEGVLLENHKSIEKQRLRTAMW